MRSEVFIPFDSPFLTSYQTSIDTYSLSRTVFEIVGFKDFRVWPWPLTFRGLVRSKILSTFIIPYMIPYLTSIDTFSLSRTDFEIFGFEDFRVWPWILTFRGHVRSKVMTLFDSSFKTSYLTSVDTFFLSRSVFEIYGFKDFWVWPLYVRGHMRLKIIILFYRTYMTFYPSSIETCFYLVPFLIYSASNILGFDLDLWPTEVYAVVW